jgi:cystathionine beta-lyase/cystathionine gamma-synthase
LLDHRLRIAGFTGAQSPFSPESAALAWRMARGLPRRLTAIAREAMEVAAERRARTIDADDVRYALRRLAPNGESVSTTDEHAGALPTSTGGTSAAAIAAAQITRAGIVPTPVPPKRRWPWNLFVP